MEKTQEVPESILNKIKKLLNHADSATKIGSLAEAEVAAAKANELLMQYNLSIDKVDRLEKKPQIEEQIISPDNLFPKNEGKWMIDLWNTISKYNFCKIITINGGMGGFYFIGQKHNKEITQYIVEQLEVKIRELARESFRNYIGPEKRGTFIRGFLSGAVTGIYHKLKAEREKIKEAQNNEMTALILVKDADLIEFVEKNHTNLRPGRSTSLSSRSGRELGYEAGKGLSINKGVAGNSANQKLIG